MELERARNELISLRKKNSELTQEVQHLKMTSTQKDKKNLELTKENNLLRLKLGSLRHKMMFQNRKLDKQLDEIDKQALNYIVQVSGLISRSMELRKQHSHNCQQLDMVPSRSDGGSPSRVGRIPPAPQSFMGHPIQPVVSLSGTLLNTHATSNASDQEAIIEESYQDEMDDSNVSETNLSDSQLEQSSSDMRLYLSPTESEDDPIHIQPPDHNPTPPTSWALDERPGGQVEMERRSTSPVMVIQKRTNTKAVVTPATATVTQATSSVIQATAAQCSRLTPQHETPLAVTPTVRRRRGSIAARGHRTPNARGHTPNARGHTPTATSSRYSPRDRVVDSPVVVISRMSTEEILAASTLSPPKSHRKLSTPKARRVTNTETMPNTSGEFNQDRAQRLSRSASTPAAETSHRARARARATLSPATSEISPFRGFDKTNDESGDSRLRRSRCRSVTPRPCSCCIDEHINTSTRTRDNSRHGNDHSRQDDNSSPVYKVKRRKKCTHDSHANKVKKHSRSRSKSKNRQDNDAPGTNVSRVAKKFASRRDTQRENDETGRSTSRQGLGQGQGQGQEAGVTSVSCRDSGSNTSNMSDMDVRRLRQRKPVTYREIPINRKMRR